MTPQAFLPRAQQLTDLQDEALAHPDAEPPSLDDELLTWVACNHFHNQQLWIQEDLARRARVTDAEIVANKRAIDRHNQARNDATERVDEILLLRLGLVSADSVRSENPLAQAPAGARLHSETAGTMVDRLSILALKIHAMQRHTERQDVDDAHRAMCELKLMRLKQQRADLATCLDSLLADAAAGRAYFKVYRQFKMYNDPRFHPGSD